MEERSWSRLAVAGLALAGAGLLVVFLAGFGYHHGWWSLRVAFGRRVLGLPLLGVLPIGTLLAMLGALLSVAGNAHDRSAPSTPSRRSEEHTSKLQSR